MSVNLTLMVSKTALENLSFKCCIDPKHLNSPFTIIAALVQSTSHSSMLCDVRMIDAPASRTFDKTFHTFCFATGSIPAVCSSTHKNSVYTFILRLTFAFKIPYLKIPASDCRLGRWQHSIFFCCLLIGLEPFC